MSFANRTKIPTGERPVTPAQRVSETDADDFAEQPPEQLPPRQSPEAADWSRIAAIGLSLAVGAIVGAGVALFLSPVSGPTARRRVRLRSRRASRYAGNAWDELGQTLYSLKQR